MPITQNYNCRLAVVATVIALVAAVAFGASAQAARASESPYCGGQSLSPGSVCAGAARVFNALYGLGSQQPVCVYPSAAADGSSPLEYIACSSGAGQGVYHGYSNVFMENATYPTIKNDGGGGSVVYGVAFQP